MTPTHATKMQATTAAAAFDAAATAMDRSIAAAAARDVELTSSSMSATTNSSRTTLSSNSNNRFDNHYSARSSPHRRSPMDAPAASEIDQRNNDSVDDSVYHDDRSDLYTLPIVSTTASRQLDNVDNSNDNSLFRLPNGQVITSKNTIQSHVAKDHVVVKGVGGSPHKNENLFRLPNGQVITPKNTIPSNDSHGDSGRRHRQGQDGTNHAAALDSARHLARHHSNTNRHDVEATPIFVDAWYPQQQPTLAALAVNGEPPADGLAIDTTATNITTTNRVGGDTTTRNADGGDGTKFKRRTAQVAIVILVLTVTVLTTLQLSASKSDVSTALDASPSPLPISPLRSLAPTVTLPSTLPAAVVPTPTDSPSPAVASTIMGPTTPTVVPSAPIAPSFQSPLVAPSSPPTITLEPSFLPPTSDPPSSEPQLPVTTLSPSISAAEPSRRATLLTNYINNIKLSNGTLTVPMSYTSTFDASTSSEQAALSWLVYEDLLQLWPNGTVARQFRLQQRYAILTLLLQFPEFAVNATSSSAQDECQWLSFAVTCVASAEPTAFGANVATELYLIGLSTAPGSTLSPDLGLLSNLVAVTIADTGFTGSLSSTLGVAWTNLKLFDVSYNDLTGSISTLLGTSWTNLERFDASSNALNGSLPSALGTTWTDLATFEVSDNALTGSLPSSLGMAWTNLTKFGASNNTLNGSLSSSLGSRWTQLETFTLHENAVTGTIPNDLARHWNNLQSATFHNTSLVGSIPSEFCTVGTLSWLSADCNEVSCPCCDTCCSDATGSCE